jgi:hypothetical protein
MHWLSEDEIRNYAPLELGEAGFCFVVAEILLARFPDATLFKLTSHASPFAHVFISIDGQYMDIGGCRDVIAETRFRLNTSLELHPADSKPVRNFFYPKYNLSQLCAARETLERYINANSGIFGRPESWRAR